MTTQTLLFTDSGEDTLFATNGTTVTALATTLSSPGFAADPIYGDISAMVVGSTVYLAMADSTDNTSAIWSYNGTKLTQITSSSNYVYNQPDSNNPTAPFPLASYGGDLIFSQASLASNTDGNNDTATLAVYNPSTGNITQPTVPNGGYDPQDFASLNGTLYFEGIDSKTTSEAIYSFNGTSVTEIYNLDPTYYNSVYGEDCTAAGAVQGPLVAFNGSLYFGSGQETVEELTSTSSLSNDARNVGGTAEYSYGNMPATDLIVANNYLFFVNGNNGVYSLSTSNTLTNLVGSIGAQSMTPVVYNNELYFVSYAVSGSNLVPNLYTSTGTSATLVSSNFDGEDFLVSGSTLYYNDNGTTLGTINGTTLGTLSVPGGVGGQPLIALPFAATAWAMGSVVSNPPVVTAGSSVTFTGGGSAVALDSGLAVADSSSTTLVGATVSIGTGLLAGDTLNFTSQSGITGSYGAGTLTLSGTASLAAYQTALDSITYSFNPSNGDPTNGGADTSRTISWVVNDGSNSSAAVTSTLGAVHEAPSIVTAGTVHFADGVSPVALDPTLSLSDPDSAGMLSSATISLGGFFSGDVLSASTAGTSITTSYNAGTGVLTLTGTDTVGDYQTVLRSVAYGISGSDTDPTHGGADFSRSVSWVVNDGVADSTAGKSTLAVSLQPVTIGDTAAGQPTTDEVTIKPFVGVTVTDPNSDQTETLTVALSSAANGTLSNLDGGTFSNGTYSLTGSASAVAAALDGLVFTPTAHQLAPGGTVTTTFTIKDTDTAGVTDSDSSTTVTATAVADPPVIAGIITVDQFTSDEAAISPFHGVSVSDVDLDQTETLTVTLSNPADGTLSNLDGGSFNSTTGIYSITGTDAAVTTALDGLVFTPTPHQVPPIGSVYTRLTIHDTDTAGASSGNGLTMVVATAVNDPPVIAGTTPGQATTDEATISPFSGVSVSDVDAGQTETLTVTLSNPANGTLSNLDGGSFNSATGIYSIHGTDAEVTTALDGLVFTPTAHQVAPGGTVTTTFNMRDIDTGGASSSNSTTTVIATAVRDPLVIANTEMFENITDAANLALFFGATVSDVDFGQTETLTVTLSNRANGTLLNINGGSYDASTGVYSITGTNAAVTTALDGLVFRPTAHQVAPGNAVRTDFVIQDTNTAGAVGGATTTVITTAAADPPVIAGTTAGQPTTDEATILPFSGVSVSDVDFGQTETLTVTLSAPGNGALSHLDGGSYDASTGVYSITGSDALVTTALDGLLFTPTAHQVAPGDAVTTGFTIQDTDTAGASSSDDTTTVIATATSDPPTIVGTAANQDVTDETTLSPFSGVSVSDVDVGQTETLTVTLSAPGNGALSNLGGGSYDASTGVYSITGSDLTVTTPLDGLVFTPTAHQVAPGDTVTTGFTIQDTDTAGSSSSDGTTTVIATATSDPPAIVGTTAGQTTTDEASLSPFSGVSVSDVDFGQTETLTITLSAPGNGALSNFDGGSYDASTGVYSITGSDLTVTTALDGLVFTPTAHQVAPGDTVTTGFTIQDTDTAGSSSSDGTTTVIATATSDPPAIVGTTAGQTTTDEASLSPFSAVSISDVDFGQTETLTVTLSAPGNGALSNLDGGNYDASTGVYSITGTDAAVTTALDGLLFTPTAHQVAPGDAVTTGFIIQDTDTAGSSSSDGTTTVIATATSDPPAIVGTTAGQTTTDEASLSPFSGVSVSDVDFGQTETLTVTMSAPGNGALSNLDGGSYDASSGIYTISGTDAVVTTALDGLVFTPTAHEVAPSQTVTTAFTLSVSDTAGLSAVDTTTSVIATAAGTVPPGEVVLHGSQAQYVIADDNGSLYIQDTVAGQDGTQILPGVTEMVFTDGIGIFDPTGVAEEVARLYQAVLGRAPDVAGLEYWTAAINSSNLSLTSLASSFVASPEFIHDYGTLSNPAFVTQLYADALDRAPDASGAQYWNDLLLSGTSRGAVALSFAESPECEAKTILTGGDQDNAEVYRLYHTAFDRVPDATGEAFWSSAMANGATLTQVAQDFVDSAEFQQDYGSPSNTNFVTQLYENALGRVPDAAGASYWGDMLASGGARGAVLLGIADGLESRVDTAEATHANWVFIPQS
jgi:plastocyanin